MLHCSAALGASDAPTDRERRRCLQEWFEPRSTGHSACDCDPYPSEACKTSARGEFRIPDRRPHRRHPRRRRCRLRRSTIHRVDDRPLRRPRKNRTLRSEFLWVWVTRRIWTSPGNPLTPRKTVKGTAPRSRQPLARPDLPRWRASKTRPPCVFNPQEPPENEHGQQFLSVDDSGSGHVGHLTGNLGWEP